MATDPKLLICYAHQDETFKNTLLAHLQDLRQQKAITVWEDLQLQEGALQLATLELELRQATVILLLVSPFFMQSDFITMPSLIRLFKQLTLTGKRVVPIILTSGNWGALEFCKTQALPKGDVPLDRTVYPIEEWQAIAKRVNRWCTEQQMTATDDMPILVDLQHLPIMSMPLVGRRFALSTLTDAFESKNTFIVSVTAPAGVGKSALVNAWLEKIAPHYLGASYVFGWSFYGQADEQPSVSSSLFLTQALRFFGHTDELPLTDDAKALRLVTLLANKPTILILDGVETLQYAPSVRRGACADLGLKTFLQILKTSPLGGQRLVVLTSRQKIIELSDIEQRGYTNLVLDNLNVGESARLLKSLGIKGSPWQLVSVVKTYKGHALALMLLGNLCVDVYAGDATQHARLPALSVAEEQGGQALRVLQFYDEKFWTVNAPERIFLQVLSLLDRPLTLVERHVLFEQAQLTKAVRKLSELEWAGVIFHLNKLGLVYTQAQQNPPTWDTHPLVRQYFREQLRTQQKDIWQDAHHQLFEHFQNFPTTNQPDTLASLEPLYRAVTHGCLAGEYEAALRVYRERILRGDQYFSTQQLGAFSADLAVIASFFEAGNWAKPINSLSIADQSWLLAQAAFYMMALGQLEEGLMPLKGAAMLCKTRQDWKNAAKAQNNRADLLLTLGRLSEAEEVAQTAIELAETSQHTFTRLLCHAKFGNLLHQLGELDYSHAAFELAEMLQVQDQPNDGQLYSLIGSQYCDLLLDTAQSAAEREAILSRAQQSLHIAEDGLGLVSIAFGRLTLGKVFNALARSQEALPLLNSAVQQLHLAEVFLYIPEALLARATAYQQLKNWELAKRDVDEVLEIAKRCNMHLYEVKANLLLANLLLDRYALQLQPNATPFLNQLGVGDNPLTQVETLYSQTSRLLYEMNYRLRLAELSLLGARLAHYTHATDSAIHHLEVAQSRIVAIEQWGLLAHWERVRTEIG
ncbi:hypothetical protein BegalDRAFT_0149 [Beggiatoa alba B18LD]|uniref:TIR domain-containing protein n=1 Tax=Beggiatoa alba B18LD TaxID=395493 RepID=I3CBS9_9GAMM|nr:TIR and AAA domain-containing protein [Beggiatoa alba]EIJ41072.1 hypothetical protein BegalDRAFT_0149 [Beggiatoa alba B18LD]